MHKWKKLVAGVLSASMIMPVAPLSVGASEQVGVVQEAEVTPTAEAAEVPSSEPTTTCLLYTSPSPRDP